MQVQRFRATTSQTLSGMNVGISNIFERELVDDTGMVARHMSALLTIYDPDTDAIVRETVFASNVIAIGADRYRVVGVEGGDGDGPGWVSLQQL